MIFFGSLNLDTLTLEQNYKDILLEKEITSHYKNQNLIKLQRKITQLESKIKSKYRKIVNNDRVNDFIKRRYLSSQSKFSGFRKFVIKRRLKVFYQKLGGEDICWVHVVWKLGSKSHFPWINDPRDGDLYLIIPEEENIPAICHYIYEGKITSSIVPPDLNCRDIAYFLSSEINPRCCDLPLSLKDLCYENDFGVEDLKKLYKL